MYFFFKYQSYEISLLRVFLNNLSSKITMYFYYLPTKCLFHCSFAWLELVSHRSFMPKLLLCNSQKGWPFFQRLLGDLFKFMEPYLRNAELGQPVSSIPAPSVAAVLYTVCVAL